MEAFAADARPNGIIGTYGADFVERFCGRGAQIKGHTHNFGVLHDKQGEFKKVHEKKCFVQLLTHCEQGEGDRALPRQSQLAANEQALREFRAWQDIENAALTAPPPNGFEQKGQFLLVTNSGRWMQVIPRFALKHASSPRAMATG